MLLLLALSLLLVRRIAAVASGRCNAAVETSACQQVSAVRPQHPQPRELYRVAPHAVHVRGEQLVEGAAAKGRGGGGP
jgi:hypothetical protein